MAAPQRANTCHGGGGIGIQYTYAELEGLWINAGGRKDYAALMAAIAVAESSGCSTALNSIQACGLWQIHPYQNGCLNAETNAKMAVAKLAGQGLVAWSTYTNGAYKQYLRGNVPPDLKTTGGGGGTPATLTAASANTCLFMLPNADPLSSLPVIGSILPNTSFCILSKSEGRAMIGALLMAGGAMILGLGTLVLVAYGLKSSGAGSAAGRALEVGGAAAAALGAPEVGLPLAAGGAAVRRQGVSRAATGAAVSRGKRQMAAKRTAGQQQAAPQQAAPQQAAPRRAAAAPARTAASTGQARPSTRAARPTDAELRAQMRQRADQISTRVPAPSGAAA